MPLSGCQYKEENIRPNANGVSSTTLVIRANKLIDGKIHLNLMLTQSTGTEGPIGNLPDWNQVRSLGNLELLVEQP